jgi:hypothetical protein
MEDRVRQNRISMGLTLAKLYPFGAPDRMQNIFTTMELRDVLLES